MYQNNTPNKTNQPPNTLSPNMNQYQQSNSPSNPQMPYQQYQQAPGNQNNLGLPQNRQAYTSMIAPQNNNMGNNRPAVGGFGKLESMGRVVREEPDPTVRVKEAPSQQTFNSGNNNNLTFKNPPG